MQLPPQSRQDYETADLNLASFLRCRGFNIEDIRDKGGRTFFAFLDSPELRRAILDFANDGLVGVRSFCNTLRDLRAIARDARSSGKRMATIALSLFLYPLSLAAVDTRSDAARSRRKFVQESIAIELTLQATAGATEKAAELRGYTEVMAAPMGSFKNWGRSPRAVLVVDRSLRGRRKLWAAIQGPPRHAAAPDWIEGRGRVYPPCPHLNARQHRQNPIRIAP